MERPARGCRREAGSWSKRRGEASWRLCVSSTLVRLVSDIVWRGFSVDSLVTGLSVCVCVCGRYQRVWEWWCVYVRYLCQRAWWLRVSLWRWSSTHSVRHWMRRLVVLNLSIPLLVQFINNVCCSCARSLSKHLLPLYTGWGQLPLSLKAKVFAEHVKSVAQFRL